jgi:hypothetical protein
LAGFCSGGFCSGGFRVGGFGSATFRAGPGSTLTLVAPVRTRPSGSFFCGFRSGFGAGAGSSGLLSRWKLVQGGLLVGRCSGHTIRLCGWLVVSSTTEAFSAGRGSDLVTGIAGSIGNAINAIRAIARTKPYVRKPCNVGQVQGFRALCGYRHKRPSMRLEYLHGGNVPHRGIQRPP